MYLLEISIAVWIVMILLFKFLFQMKWWVVIVLSLVLGGVYAFNFYPKLMLLGKWEGGKFLDEEYFETMADPATRFGYKNSEFASEIASQEPYEEIVRLEFKFGKIFGRGNGILEIEKKLGPSLSEKMIIEFSWDRRLVDLQYDSDVKLSYFSKIFIDEKGIKDKEPLFSEIDFVTDWAYSFDKGLQSDDLKLEDIKTEYKHLFFYTPKRHRLYDLKRK